MGVTGAQGAQGPAGVTGAQGQPAPYPPTTITSGYAANTNGGLITVIVGGTNISLPNSQLLASGITMAGSNTIMRIATAGFYRLSYHINTTASLLMGSRLIINGGVSTPSIIPPVVSISSFNNSLETYLPANSEISLQMYAPVLGLATLLGGSLGASLMAIRLGS